MRAGGRALALGMTATAALTLSGCSQSASHDGAVTRAAVTYSCCRAADITPVRHPGETVRVHWIVVADGPGSAPSGAAGVTLSASLSGPYADVTTLKATSSRAPGPAADADPVRTTDQAHAAPVSTLVIPADAGSGFYNLTTTVDDGAGTVSAGSIIRVAAR